MSLTTKYSAVSHLVQTYLTALPSILYRTTLSLVFDPRGTQRFLHQVLNARDLECRDSVLESTDIESLLALQDREVELVGAYYKIRASDTRSLLELACLAALVSSLKPTLIFEFGTYIGRTSRLFAKNSPADTRILTLDLPPDQAGHRIGEAYVGTPEQVKITQCYGDSLTFDCSPWFGKVDFVWIDACHEYRYVLSDTKNALRLCRPGGWIAWHDYRHSAWWSGVTRCVRELHRKIPHICHLYGTTIALLRVEKQDLANI